MICQRLLAWLGLLRHVPDIASNIKVLEMIKDTTVINDNNYLMSFFVESLC